MLILVTSSFVMPQKTDINVDNRVKHLQMVPTSAKSKDPSDAIRVTACIAIAMLIKRFASVSVFPAEDAKRR